MSRSGTWPRPRPRSRCVTPPWPIRPSRSRSVSNRPMSRGRGLCPGFSLGPVVLLWLLPRRRTREQPPGPWPPVSTNRARCSRPGGGPRPSPVSIWRRVLGPVSRRPISSTPPMWVPAPGICGAVRVRWSRLMVPAPRLSATACVGQGRAVDRSERRQPSAGRRGRSGSVDGPDRTTGRRLTRPSGRPATRRSELVCRRSPGPPTGHARADRHPRTPRPGLTAPGSLPFEAPRCPARACVGIPGPELCTDHRPCAS